MIHWKGLSTGQKICAIKSVYQPGMSAAYIASNIVGVTRNSIIGMYNRHGEHLADCPLQGGGRRSQAEANKGNIGKPRAARKARAERTFTLKPMFAAARRIGFVPTQPPVILHAPHVAGMPLMMMKANQCRFPVNDAARGETHLFCGSKAEGKWCGFHHRVVYRDPARTTGKGTHE